MRQNNRAYSYFVILTFTFAFVATQLVDLEKIDMAQIDTQVPKYLEAKETKVIYSSPSRISSGSKIQKREFKTTLSKHNHSQSNESWLKNMIEKRSHYLEDAELETA